jgi:hypothetical protein
MSANEPPSGADHQTVVSNIGAQMAVRMSRLSMELDQCDEVDVFGVVDPSGVGGAGSDRREPDTWTLLFSLAIWRIGENPIQRQKLTARKKVPKAEIEKTQKLIGSYDVVHIKARVAFENVLGSPQALLLEVLGHCDTDLERLAAAQEVQKPVTFHDSQFGAFLLDRRINWFEARTTLEGVDVRLSLSTGELGKVEELLATSRILFGAEHSWYKRITDYAVSKLLQLKNDAWLGEDESEFSESEFRSKMELSSILIKSGGRFEFWYEDGDLFWGHSIMVSGDLFNGPKDAGIHG